MQSSWVGYGSAVRVSASYSTYSVSHLFSIIPPRGSVRVQELGLVPVIALIQFRTYSVLYLLVGRLGFRSKR